MIWTCYRCCLAFDGDKILPLVEVEGEPYCARCTERMDAEFDAAQDAEAERLSEKEA